MKEQVCPHCGAVSPAEAVICWACYTPLGARKASASPSPTIPETEISAKTKLKRWVSDAAPWAAIVGLAANGWLPRRARWPVLGAGLSVLGGPLLLTQWKQLAGDKSADAAMNEAEKSISVRIAETVFSCALQAKSNRVRIEESGQSVRFKYQIEGEWREQIAMPLRDWRSLRHQLLLCARQGEFRAAAPRSLEPNPLTLKLTEMSARLETGAQGETLELQFESALPGEFEAGMSLELMLDSAPDIACWHCQELNSSTAVWCWNCGDILKHKNFLREKEAVGTAVVVGALSVLASSGWWPRRARWPILGACALGLAAPLILNQLNQRQKRQRIEDDEKRGITPGWEPPVQRMAGLLLLRAIRQNRASMRLRETGNVIVSHQIGEQWRQDAVFPGWVWLALRTRLLKMARETFTCQGKRFSMRAQLSSDVNGETLLLQFEDAR